MSRRLILRAGLRAAGVALAVSAPLTAFADQGSSCAETCVPSTLVQKAGCADTACGNTASGSTTGGNTACTTGSSCTATAIPSCTTSNCTTTQAGCADAGCAPAGHVAAPAAAPADASQPTGLFQFVATPPATPPATPAGPQTAVFSAEESSAGDPADPSAGPSDIEQVAGFTLPTKADEADTRAHRIASREGSGFRGFCPVVLRDQRDLADAQTGIFSVYESRTYRFSSAEAKAQFDADPAKYAPIRGGVDIVLLAEEGTEEDGSLAHAHWFRDRLFFFTRESTAVRFFNDPTRYVSE